MSLTLKSKNFTIRLALKTWVRNLTLFISVFFIISGCIDPFDPPPGDYEELLVVDAFISDDDEPQVVKLSLSYPIDTTIMKPVAFANVSIKDDLGSTYTLENGGNGSYYTDPLLFKPEVGRSYSLSITLGEGRNYSSDPVFMKTSPPIDSVYHEIDRAINSNSGQVEDGIQIKLSSTGQQGETGYYRYEWHETFGVVAPYPSFYDYDPINKVAIPRENDITHCWASDSSTSIMLESTDGRTTNTVEGKNIRFISFKNPVLNTEYSIEVKQFQLDKESYFFWKSLAETNESTGSLFDVQPFPLTGNVHNTSDNDEPVLGYFDMSTVSKKRIFLTYRVIPAGTPVPILYPECLSPNNEVLVAQSDLPRSISAGYLISTYNMGTGMYSVYLRPCIDCTMRASPVKPDFWE